MPTDSLFSKLTLLSKLKYLNIQNNLLFWCFLLVLATFSITVIIFETQLIDSVMTEVEENQKITASRIDDQFQEKLSKYRNDIRFLFGTPPIAGLANSGNDHKDFDDSTYEQWRTRLETVFTSFIENNSEYEQLRIISAHNEGKELVRTERNSGSVKIVNDQHLQNKHNNDYYFQSTQLFDGQIYISPISLNREFGEIEFPYRPMLRLSIPIFDNKMNRFGFLIANINATKLLDSLKSLVYQQDHLVLSDSDGYFLLHPNSEFMFSKDLNPNVTWKHNYNSQHFPNTELDVVTNRQNAKAYSFGKKIVVSGGIENGFITAQILTPDSVVNQLAMDRRTSIYTFLVVITIILLFILVVFQRGLRKSQELAEARAESDAIINGTKDAIFGLSPSGRVSSWNRAAKTFFELTIDQVRGKSIIELALFPEVDFDALIQKLSSGFQQQTIQTSIHSNSETERLVSLSLSAIMKDGTKFSGVAVIVRDVTNERKADEKIRKANTELEAKVALRTTELEKASHVKSAFISNISHEMRTPLNGIIGTLNLIKKDELSDQQKLYLEMTEVSVNALAVLINDILDLSKIEAGKLDLDYKEFNPRKLIESLCGSMAVKAQEKGIEFILDTVDINCEAIISDPHRFSQILNNILNNAIKFTCEGYILVKAYSKHIDDSHCGLCCEVTDTGIGIAEENQKRLFNAFSQEDSGIASKYGGTGLGLSICKQLSQLLNGQITFESTKDRGSTFHIQINIPNVNVKYKTPEKRLHDKLVTVLVPHFQLQQSLVNLVTKLGATVLDDNKLTEYLESKVELPLELPNIIIADQLDPRIQLLAHRWDAIKEVNNPPEKVVILHNAAEAKTLCKRLAPVYISKPVAISEFLLKCVERRQDAVTDDTLKRRTTDSTAVFNNKLTGARVLVVDDNEINVEVAIGILSSTAAILLKATNGQEAIDKLLESETKGETIHCVLMDCQMPVLNGYDATTKIRNGAAGPGYVDVPIIAITASAMMGERQKCLDAGMSDYITKPISAEKLTSKLTKWVLSVYEPSVKIIGDDTTVDPFSDKDDSVWDRDAALTRLMNNQDLLHKICHLFLDGSPDKLLKLSASIDANAFDEIRTVSHSFKGIAGDIGALRLHETLGNIELEAEKQNSRPIAILFSKLQKQYEILEGVLKKYLKNNESNP